MLVKGMRRVGVLKIVILVLFLVMGTRHVFILMLLLGITVVLGRAHVMVLISVILVVTVVMGITHAIPSILRISPWEIEAVLKLEVAKRLVCVRGPKIW